MTMNISQQHSKYCSKLKMCANGLPDKNMAITTQLTIENQ